MNMNLEIPRHNRRGPEAQRAHWSVGALSWLAGMLSVVLAVGLLQHLKASGTDLPASRAVASRSLMIADAPGGAVEVRDARTGDIVTVVKGQAGFFRVTLRGMAQERNLESLPANKPFQLTRWADGRLTLDDPLTQRHVELAAFGPTNETVFANLLTGNEQAGGNAPASDAATMQPTQGK